MSQDETYLRDIFAGLVLNGIVKTAKVLNNMDWDLVSQTSYKIADAMMKARKDESIS